MTHPARKSAEPEPQPSAEIIPFPICRTSSWRFIAEQYASRPEKGRYSKGVYAEKVIAGNIERLRGFGVSQDRIDAEISQLKSLFSAMNAADEKLRA